MLERVAERAKKMSSAPQSEITKMLTIAREKAGQQLLWM